MSRFRGETVDIGGRRLRAVEAGPACDRPTIVLEAGAFGCAADWAEVQQRLAAKGLHSLAYDRAGLGHSDPGPLPRDGRAIAADLHALLAATGHTRPVVLVGHSMGGLMARLFAGLHPERVAGLVLVDAATPEAYQTPAVAREVARYGHATRWTGWLAYTGVMRPFALALGDVIGLPPEAAREKRRIYGSKGHTLVSAEEVRHWPSMAALALEAPPREGLPVAAIHAGAPGVARRIKTIVASPASAYGYVEHTPGANHASLLGRRFSDAIVRGVEHVLHTAELQKA